jgi:hypothetical protein
VLRGSIVEGSHQGDRGVELLANMGVRMAI